MGGAHTVRVDRATCKLRARETPSGSQEPTHDLPLPRPHLTPPELGRRLPLHQREPWQQPPVLPQVPEHGPLQQFPRLLRQVAAADADGLFPQLPDRLRVAARVGGSNLPEKTRKLLEGAVLGYLRKNRGLLPRFSLATGGGGSE